jgi:hypothetical protein
MHTLDTEDQIAAHRRFLLHLSPMASQLYAAKFGNYPVPSVDVQAAESIEVDEHYLRMQNSGGLAHVNEASWWMVPLLDPQRRYTRERTNMTCEALTSYAVATIRGLMDMGVLQWAKDVPIPDISSMVGGTKLDETDEAVIARMEKQFTQESEEDVQ